MTIILLININVCITANDEYSSSFFLIQISELFSAYRGEVFTMTNPTKEERRLYFKPLFYKEMIKVKKVRCYEDKACGINVGKWGRLLKMAIFFC